jgi:hypothetical protein
MVSHNKFDTDNYLMFFLKSGETHVGLLKRPYDNVHPYWYIKLEGDETIVAIPDHVIETIIRPSESFIANFGKFMKEAQEKKDKPDINPTHDESINV